MHKLNRLNHDFQILYFLIGSCHTADAAYALLCNQRDDRKLAINSSKAEEFKQKARLLRANKMLNSDDAAVRLDGQAEIAEIEAFKQTVDNNITGAVAELSFIENCIAKIQPYRKYKHLSDAEAYEACQQEEWKLELIYRAENYLLTTGTIPTDHFSTMRMHPEFNTVLLPTINDMKKLIGTSNGHNILLNKSNKKNFLLSDMEIRNVLTK